VTTQETTFVDVDVVSGLKSSSTDFSLNSKTIRHSYYSHLDEEYIFFYYFHC